MCTNATTHESAAGKANEKLELPYDDETVPQIIKYWLRPRMHEHKKCELHRHGERVEQRRKKRKVEKSYDSMGSRRRWKGNGSAINFISYFFFSFRPLCMNNKLKTTRNKLSWGFSDALQPKSGRLSASKPEKRINRTCEYKFSTESNHHRGSSSILLRLCIHHLCVCVHMAWRIEDFHAQYEQLNWRMDPFPGRWF